MLESDQDSDDGPQVQTPKRSKNGIAGETKKKKRDRQKSEGKLETEEERKYVNVKRKGDLGLGEWKPKKRDVGTYEHPEEPAPISKQERKRLKKLRKEKKLLKHVIKNADMDSQSERIVEPTSDSTVVADSLAVPGKRQYTVSIAVAGSIVDNAQSMELKAYLCGQVARAAGMFNVDEIIVFNDAGEKDTPGCEHMELLLQYLECPQYLRKHCFPLLPELKYVGLISPLDLPHHLRKEEILPYREGVIVSKPCKGEGSYANVGLEKEVRVDVPLVEGVRVTVKLNNPESISRKGALRGKVVSPFLPREEAGLYWGYTVRPAKNFSSIFTESTFKGGYDITVGTSDKGKPVSQLKLKKSFQHFLVVFGGVQGLEYACDNDYQNLEGKEVIDYFDHYVNTCPNQGTRTIRTEEAILITMAALVPHIEKAQEQ